MYKTNGIDHSYFNSVNQPVIWYCNPITHKVIQSPIQQFSLNVKMQSNADKTSYFWTSFLAAEDKFNNFTDNWFKKVI